MAAADSSVPLPYRFRHSSLIFQTSTEASQGKLRILHLGSTGSTCTRVWMVVGLPRPLPGYPTVPASYPVSVRWIQVPSSASFRSHLAMGTLA